MLEVVAELPMLALILHLVAMPMPMGSRLRWFTLAGIIRRPRAISLRINSGSIFSRPATKRISSGITAPAAPCLLRHIAVTVGRRLIALALFDPFIPKRHKAPSETHAHRTDAVCF